MDAATLQRAMPGLPASRARQLVGPCNAAMVKGGITTRRRAAYFLAQVGHESVSLRYKAEIGGANTRYAPHYGRTFIQVTWEENYRRFGQWLGKGDYFVRNPSALERDEYAWLGPVWYWTTQRSCNALCDKGDFVGLTRAINGGINGLADRQERLARIEKLGDAILPTKPDPLKGLSAPERKIAQGRIRHEREIRAGRNLAANRRWSRWYRVRIRAQQRRLWLDAKVRGWGAGRGARWQILDGVVEGRIH